MPKTTADITGQTFGGIRVLRRADPPSINGRSYWEVRCLRCGREYAKAASAIMGKTPAGCVQCQRAKDFADVAKQSQAKRVLICRGCGRQFRAVCHAKYCSAADCQRRVSVVLFVRQSEMRRLVAAAIVEQSKPVSIIRRLLKDAGYLGD